MAKVGQCHCESGLLKNAMLILLIMVGSDEEHDDKDWIWIGFESDLDMIWNVRH